MEALRIKTRINRRTGFLVTIWSSPGVTLPEVPTALRENQLPRLRARLGNLLQKAKEAIGSELRPSWPRIDAAMEVLHDAGYYLLSQLFPQNPKAVVEIWREALAESIENERDPPVVTLIGVEKTLAAVRGSTLLLPLEFLPLFRVEGSGPGRRKRIDSLPALREAVREFVGYRCIVSRVLPTVGELVPRVKKEKLLTCLPEEPRLPAKVFVCRTLGHVGREEWRLRRQLEASVWPRKGIVGTAADLAEFLWHVTHCTRRLERKIPDQIHHFASHFDTTSFDCEEHAIRLAGCANSEFEVTLWQLNAKVAELKVGGPLPSRNMRPLVFVNACGTSKMDPDGALSLPDLFLGPLLCSRGFIGTETTMSDPVAMEFATWFYERLLRGAPIGRALHDSRRRLVEEFRNPLGLFYTCYAHPELRIAIMRN